MIKHEVQLSWSQDTEGQSKPETLGYQHMHARSRPAQGTHLALVAAATKLAQLHEVAVVALRRLAPPAPTPKHATAKACGRATNGVSTHGSISGVRR